MNELKQTYNSNPRARLRLGEVQRLIRRHRILVPPPSRPTLIKLCERGVFETVGGRPTSFGWLIYEDSFWEWARNMGGEAE